MVMLLFLYPKLKYPLNNSDIGGVLGGKNKRASQLSSCSENISRPISKYQQQVNFYE